MWGRLFGLNILRTHRCRRAPPGPLRAYYSTPFPARARRLAEVRFVAVDLETTGKDPTRDEILSIGMIDLRCDCIDLGSANHFYLAPGCGIPEASAIIHQITDDQAAAGSALAQIIPRALSQLSGRVMIAHHAGMERSFLDAACRRLYGVGLALPVIDTETLFRRRFDRHGQVYQAADLRLHALRERAGLPRYRAHNALSDALAVAELFLAFLAHAGIGSDQRLGRVLTG